MYYNIKMKNVLTGNMISRKLPLKFDVNIVKIVFCGQSSIHIEYLFFVVEQWFDENI